MPLHIMNTRQKDLAPTDFMVVVQMSKKATALNKLQLSQY